ncbi:MAG: hypothetical protein LBJ16_02165 [Holosporaceae bacterium]|jgi:hypothetical protein|nr:hypothetical protein [Holosporaceae bacterium]
MKKDLAKILYIAIPIIGFAEYSSGMIEKYNNMPTEVKKGETAKLVDYNSGVEPAGCVSLSPSCSVNTPETTTDKNVSTQSKLRNAAKQKIEIHDEPSRLTVYSSACQNTCQNTCQNNGDKIGNGNENLLAIFSDLPKDLKRCWAPFFIKGYKIPDRGILGKNGAVLSIHREVVNHLRAMGATVHISEKKGSDIVNLFSLSNLRLTSFLTTRAGWQLSSLLTTSVLFEFTFTYLLPAIFSTELCRGKARIDIIRDLFNPHLATFPDGTPTQYCWWSKLVKWWDCNLRTKKELVLGPISVAYFLVDYISEQPEVLDVLFGSFPGLEAIRGLYDGADSSGGGARDPNSLIGWYELM